MPLTNLLYNQLESTSGVTANPNGNIVGTGGTFDMGGDYGPTKWGNAVLGYSHAYGGPNYSYFDNIAFGKVFSISFYVLPIMVMGNTYLIYEGTHVNSFQIVSISDYPPNALQVSNWDNAGAAICTYQFNDFVYDIGVPFHVGIIFDSDAGTGYRIKLFQDGLPVTFKFTNADNAWTPYTGTFVCAGAWEGLAVGYIDNLKIWDGAVTDNFAWDIANEGLPTSPTTTRKLHRQITN